MGNDKGLNDKELNNNELETCKQPNPHRRTEKVTQESNDRIHNELKKEANQILGMLGVNKTIEEYNFFSLISEIIQNSQNTGKSLNESISPALKVLTLDEIQNLLNIIDEILKQQTSLIQYCRKKGYNLTFDLTSPLSSKNLKKSNLQQGKNRTDENILTVEHLIEDTLKCDEIEVINIYLGVIDYTIKDLEDFLKTKYNLNLENKKINRFLNKNLNLFYKLRNYQIAKEFIESGHFTGNPGYYYKKFGIDLHETLDDFLAIIACQTGSSSNEGCYGEAEKEKINNAIRNMLGKQSMLLSLFDNILDSLNGEGDFDTKFSKVYNHEEFRNKVAESEEEIKNNTVKVYKAIVDGYGLNPDNQEIIDYFNNKFNLMNFYYEHNNSERRIPIIENYRKEEKSGE